MRFIYIAVTVFVLAYHTSAYAWDTNGHRIIARLTDHWLQPCTRDRIEDWLQQLDASGRERDIGDLVAAADWMDRVRHASDCDDQATTYCLPPPGSWHYIDQAFVLAGAPPAAPLPRAHVVWALEQAIAMLNARRSSNEQKAYAILIIEHLVGDIGQPLHNMSGYSESTPDGDRGGNLYPIGYGVENSAHGHGHSNNLHAFWDQGAGMYHGHHGDKKFIDSQVDRLQTLYAKSPEVFNTMLITSTTPDAWHHQAFTYAASVYNTPRFAVPAPSYVAWARSLVDQQMILSGLRLAKLLNEALVSNGTCATPRRGEIEHGETPPG